MHEKRGTWRVGARVKKDESAEKKKKMKCKQLDGDSHFLYAGGRKEKVPKEGNYK